MDRGSPDFESWLGIDNAGKPVKLQGELKTGSPVESAVGASEFVAGKR